MAALEKIRSKAVLLTVVIGLALLAFILTDFLNSGRTFFGDGNTVAYVGDTKIDAMQFQNRYEQASQELQSSGRNNIDGAVLQSQVMSQMIQEILLNDELEMLDIDVTDEEITDAMIGNNIRPQVMQLVQQTGMQSARDLYDLIFNPSKYGATDADVAQMRNMWINLEDDVTRSLKYEKLQNLIMGAIRANDLDKKEMA